MGGFLTKLMLVVKFYIKQYLQISIFMSFDLITIFVSDWNVLVVGKISSYLDCESEDSERRTLSEMALLQELAYSSHLGFSAIMMSLNHPHNNNLARILRGKLISNFTPTVSLLVNILQFISCIFRMYIWSLENIIEVCVI